jgi:hypothetical protein
MRDCGLTCPKCGRQAVIKTKREVYGKKVGGGFLWTCPRFPWHDCVVGCHPRTAKPLGTLADKETRQARYRAHQAFDRLWKPAECNRIFGSRTEAYKKLSIWMNLKERDTHIGMMNMEQCENVIKFCAKILSVGRL